jgi:hypothetical protein
VIVFDLDCGQCGQRCESWFGSNADYEHQRDEGLLACPQCGSAGLAKAPMAPAVPRKASQSIAAIARVQQELLKESRWVGEKFVETARAMHSGEAEAEPVHGQATLGEARDLIDDGIPVCPLPLPVIPPGQVN